MTAIKTRLTRLENNPPARPTAADNGYDTVPNIIEFVTDDRYLGQQLYPRQATLLKIMTLQSELFTDYDGQVIDTWRAGYTLLDDETGARYVGKIGTPPDLYERIQTSRDLGRSSFRECVLVMGRRGGKGALAAKLIAYKLWELLTLDDPQRELGIETGKDISVVIVAGSKDQAQANLFRDVLRTILDAECFKPYLSSKGTKHLRLRTRADARRDPDGPGSIVIDARATTTISGRGPASMIVAFDEMAYAPADGHARGADEIYRGAKPSLAQFPTRSLMLLTSSPDTQQTEFYAAHCRACAVRDGAPNDPGMFTVQLRSWDPYEDWERAATIEMWPGGPCFAPLKGAIIAYDEDLRREERDNPEYFDVEYRAQWRSGPHAYLPRDDVDAMFGPFNGQVLTQQTAGVTRFGYVMHCDPSKVGANFALAIGHLEGDRNTGDVVFDVIEALQPHDFPDGVILYPEVEDHVFRLATNFDATVSFDQFNSTQMIQNLNNRFARERGRFQERAFERTATASRNWEAAENFKRLLIAGRIHAPHHALAKAELLALEVNGMRVSHPSHGSVQTDDIVDAMFAVVDQLISPDHETLQRLGETQLMADIRARFRASRTPLSLMGQPRGASQVPNPARGRGANRMNPGNRY